MTVIELVRTYFPGISDADADSLLWEQTGFLVTRGLGLRTVRHE